jgi:hypothetical protein
MGGFIIEGLKKIRFGVFFFFFFFFGRLLGPKNIAKVNEFPCLITQPVLKLGSCTWAQTNWESVQKNLVKAEFHFFPSISQNN